MSMLSGPWTRARIKSFFFLAVAFWRRQLRRLVGLGRRDEGGAARFLENFAPEGMAPLTLEQEEHLKRLGACIQCGLCEALGQTPADRGPAWTRAIATRRLLDQPGDGSEGITSCPVGLAPSASPAPGARS